MEITQGSVKRSAQVIGIIMVDRVIIQKRHGCLLSAPLTWAITRRESIVK